MSDTTKDSPVRNTELGPEEEERKDQIGMYSDASAKILNSQIVLAVEKVGLLEDVVGIVSLAGARRKSELAMRPGLGRLPGTVLTAARDDLDTEIPCMERAVGVPWKRPNPATPAQLLLALANRARSEMWNISSARAFYDVMDEIADRRLDGKPDGTVMNLNERSIFMNLYPNLTHVSKPPGLGSALPRATPLGKIDVEDSAPIHKVWTTSS